MVSNKLLFDGVGIGVRSEYYQELARTENQVADFLELAPENWMHMGGRKNKVLRQLAERYPIVAHGLCLSIGGPTPLDKQFLSDLKDFMREFNIVYYSEHLSYCSDENGLLYDLMPMPFTEESVSYVAGRIREVQDYLGQRIAMENVSYYCAPGQRISESDYINAVISEADCDLLLDVNNIYVNSINHGYDPYEFLMQMPLDKVSYVHVAGHLVESENLLIDTHGEAVCQSVWQLLTYFYRNYGLAPTLLERDNNVPNLKDVLAEVEIINEVRQPCFAEMGHG